MERLRWRRFGVVKTFAAFVAVRARAFATG
jgi:hypothetical protein